MKKIFFSYCEQLKTRLVNNLDTSHAFTFWPSRSDRLPFFLVFLVFSLMYFFSYSFFSPSLSSLLPSLCAELNAQVLNNGQCCKPSTANREIPPPRGICLKNVIGAYLELLDLFFCVRSLSLSAEFRSLSACHSSDRNYQNRLQHVGY